MAKALITLGVVLPFGLGGKTAVFTALGMIQIGEFSYVLARAGREAGVISDTLNSLILTSSLVTIVLTPAAFWAAPRVDLMLARLPGVGRRFRPRPARARRCRRSPMGHAIVVGYGRVGRRVVAGLRAAGLPVTVIEDDLHLVHEIAEQGIAAVYGDASYRAIMAAAHAERARLVVVALPDAGDDARGGAERAAGQPDGADPGAGGARGVRRAGARRPGRRRSWRRSAPAR